MAVAMASDRSLWLTSWAFAGVARPKASADASESPAIAHAVLDMGRPPLRTPPPRRHGCDKVTSVHRKAGGDHTTDRFSWLGARTRRPARRYHLILAKSLAPRPGIRTSSLV